MEAPSQLWLTRYSTLKQELAAIVSISRDVAKVKIDATWWSNLSDALDSPENQPDSHWEWRGLVSMYQNNPYYRAVGIQTIDGAIQAAMIFRVNALSALALGHRALFVERLASAPRNRRILVPAPVFRGCGEGLLKYAVAMSISLGFSGRVNLFPIANLPFYIDRGFVQTGTNHEGETLYELPADAARAILEKGGEIND